jgi:hypothetical protein
MNEDLSYLESPELVECEQCNLSKGYMCASCFNILLEKLEYLHEIDFVTSDIKDAVKDSVLEFKSILIGYGDKYLLKEFNKEFGEFEYKNNHIKAGKQIYRKGNITYYKSKKDALERRNKGDRMYYKAGELKE